MNKDEIQKLKDWQKIDKAVPAKVNAWRQDVLSRGAAAEVIGALNDLAKHMGSDTRFMLAPSETAAEAPIPPKGTKGK